MTDIRQIWLFIISICVFNSPTVKSDQDPVHRGSEIIGGMPCPVMEYSFIVSVISEGLCGGSMVTLQWVLTAAHCLGHPSWTKVRAGFNAPSKYIQVRRGKKLIRHEKFTSPIDKKRPELRYDIGLILLNAPFKKTPYLTTATLATSGYSAGCKQGKVLGIGASEWPSEEKDQEPFFERKLMCVDLPIVNSTTCSLTFPEAIKIDYSIICTMATQGKDACSGDSGGPLLCEGKVVVGLVSVGRGCAIEKLSATYTRVEEYLPFINQTMKYELEAAGRSGVDRVKLWKVLLTVYMWSKVII